jgi:hypothetical protein
MGASSASGPEFNRTAEFTLALHRAYAVITVKCTENVNELAQILDELIAAEPAVRRTIVAPTISSNLEEKL